MQDQKFLYKEPPIKMFIFVAVFFSVFAFFSYICAINKEEVNYKGIHLSQDASIIVNWCMFVFFAALATLYLYVAIKLMSAKKIKKYLVFKTISFSGYKGILEDKLVHINYSDITGIKFYTVKGQKNLKIKYKTCIKSYNLKGQGNLKIKYKNGYLTLTDSNFSKSDYMQISALVVSRANHLLKA